MSSIHSGWNAAAYLAEEIRDPTQSAARPDRPAHSSIVISGTLLNILHFRMSTVESSRACQERVMPFRRRPLPQPARMT